MELFVAQYHSYDRHDSNDADRVLGIFQSEHQAKQAIRDDIGDNGFLLEDLVESVLGSERLEYAFDESPDFVYVITTHQI